MQQRIWLSLLYLGCFGAGGTLLLLGSVCKTIPALGRRAVRYFGFVGLLYIGGNKFTRRIVRRIIAAFSAGSTRLRRPQRHDASLTSEPLVTFKDSNDHVSNCPFSGGRRTLFTKTVALPSPLHGRREPGSIQP